MPRRREVGIESAKEFADFGKLQVSLEEVEEELERGAVLVYESSCFEDPGEDYSALYLGERRVGFWPGY